MKLRVSITVILMVLLSSVSFIYAMFEPTFEGAAAVKQLNPSTNETYVASKALSQGILINAMVWFIVALLILLWLPVASKQLKKLWSELCEKQ